MDTVVLVSLVMATTALALWVDAPRQARRLTVSTPVALRPTSDSTVVALEHELCTRLRLAAVGGGIGVVLAAVPLLIQGVSGEGPDAITAVATVLSSTVVTAVATEAAAVLRRTPRATGKPRTAALTPRAAHDGRTETVAELLLAALALAAFALGIGLLTREGDGAAGSVGAGAGALVVIVVCAVVRRIFVRHRLAATTSDELSIRAAAGAVTRNRFSENLVASGGVLTLAALLGPISAGGQASQAVAAALVVATLAVMAVLVIARRARRTSVPA